MKPPIPTDLGLWGAGPGEKGRRYAIGLFVVSLAVLFLASLVGYVVIRKGGDGAVDPVDIPVGLWVSTGILALCGLAVAWTQRAAAEPPSLYRLKWGLTASLALSLAFVVVQAPSVLMLADTHVENLGAERDGAEGLVVTLITLHALHVIGGLFPLGLLTIHAWRGRLIVAHIGAVRSCAVYWHFLEGVWLTLFAVVLIVR